MLRQQIVTINTIPQNTINQRNKNLINQGHVDNKKHEDYVRILTLNPRGLRLDDEEKVELMIQSVQRYQIDGLLLISPDRKWKLSKIESIK